MGSLLVLLSLMMALGSCSTYRGKEKLDQTTMAYGRIMRWEKFETASLFAASSIRDEFEKRVKNAKDVEVVDYRIINVEHDEAKRKATVNVEISYVPPSSNQVKTLIDKQIWVYGSEGWQLTTLLPEFK
jgi:hypothetical protein